MSDTYHQLLDATIQHLKDLKARGVRFVPVSQQALAGLNTTRIARSPFAAPPHKAAQLTALPKPAPPRAAEPGQPETPSVEARSLALDSPAGAPAASSPGLSPQAKVAAFAELR